MSSQRYTPEFKDEARIPLGYISSPSSDFSALLPKTAQNEKVTKPQALLSCVCSPANNSNPFSYHLLSV